MPSLIRTAEICPYSFDTTGHLSSFFTTGPEPEARIPSACTFAQKANKITQHCTTLIDIVPFELHILERKISHILSSKKRPLNREREGYVAFAWTRGVGKSHLILFSLYSYIMLIKFLVPYVYHEQIYTVLHLFINIYFD